MLWINTPINPPINPGIKTPIISIGLPILIFLLVFMLSVYLLILIQKGKLQIQESISWTLWNIFMMLVSLSLLVTQILSTVGKSNFNWMQWSANVLGLTSNNGWIILLIILFIIFLYFKSIRSTLKISNLQKKVSRSLESIAVLEKKIDDINKK